jgi:hypothetical protein
LRAERKAHDATDEGQTVACAGTLPIVDLLVCT